MADLQTTDCLLKLFQAHGITCVAENDWVAPNGELPALRALWWPAQPNGRLDVQVLVRDQIVIVECFAGVGEGERAMYDALSMFILNVFHVLLAALWGKNDCEQVTTERWTIGGRAYVAYIGNFAMRGFGGVTAEVPHGLFAAIEEAIKSEPLTGDIHWFRLFVGHVENTFTFEALRDNETWESGAECLMAATWEQAPGYYSVRFFALLRAA
jgi:hypothetical protein